MFSGIIEAVGHVDTRHPYGTGARFAFRTELAGSLAIGESIAVNGTCLTVVARTADRFWVDCSATTLETTGLAMLAPGDAVNLERALRVGDRLSGHFVAGHVDGIAVVRRIEADGDTRRLVVEVPPPMAAWLAPKGSVALDGVSLTIVDTVGATFSVTVIPHTLRATTLQGWRVGQLVNIEADLLAKYVAEWLQATRQGGANRG
jgi:riboflavin synthase